MRDPNDRDAQTQWLLTHYAVNIVVLNIDIVPLPVSREPRVFTNVHLVEYLLLFVI